MGVRFSGMSIMGFHCIPVNAALQFDWLLDVLELAQGFGLVRPDPSSPHVSWVGSGHETT